MEEGRCKATWEREIKLPWREAGPPNHHWCRQVTVRSSNVALTPTLLFFDSGGEDVLEQLEVTPPTTGVPRS